MHLRRYQEEGVAFLSGHESALLADEMGLGKTIQVAVAIDRLRAAGRLQRSLIVVPTPLKLNWVVEFERWAPQVAIRQVRGDASERMANYMLPIPVLVASYDQVLRDEERLRGTSNFDLVVLDEAQRIKNPDSATASSIRRLRRRLSWALTGTPLENSISDLRAVFSFVRPKLRLDGLEGESLIRAIQADTLRRTQEEVLPELPPVIDQTIRLEMRGQQLAEYQSLWFSRHRLFDPESAATGLALITRLKQACNYAFSEDESVKTDALQEILSGLPAGSRVLVFSQYVETLRYIASKVDQACLMFHGAQSEAEKEHSLREFRKIEPKAKPKILLMSLRAGGVGLNLQEADLVVLFDRWWNPAVENQAIGRALRFGRVGPLRIIRFLVDDSVEERIQNILEDKQAVFEELVGRPELGRADKLPKDLISDVLR